MILFRSCAVSTGSSIIMVGGHNNQSTESLNIMLEMTKVNVQNTITLTLMSIFILGMSYTLVFSGRRLDLWSVHDRE